MKPFCLAVAFVLMIVIMNVFSICPESGCGCNKHCVNGSNKWCSNNNDAKCSCKTGCLIFDTLLQFGDSAGVYCNACGCSPTHAWVTLMCRCSLRGWCFPEEFTLGVHYPDDTQKSPNCDEQESTSQ